jgi:hypothetical protein
MRRCYWRQDVSMSDFQRRPLCKPRVEIQVLAVFQALFETYHPDTDSDAETILSLEGGRAGELVTINGMPADCQHGPRA